MQRILERLNAAILLCMFGVTVLTVIFRSVLGIPASWSEDLAQLTFILLVFIGAAAVMKDDAHIRIDSMVDLLPPRWRLRLRRLCWLLTIPFLVLFGVGAWDNALNNWEVPLGTVEWISIGYIYLALVVTTVIMLVYTLSLLFAGPPGDVPRAGDEGQPAGRGESR